MVAFFLLVGTENAKKIETAAQEEAAIGAEAILTQADLKRSAFPTSSTLLETHLTWTLLSALIIMTGARKGSAPQTFKRGGERMTDTMSGQELHPTVLELARGQNFAALTTLLPGGHPQTQVMWVDADDQHLLINTEVHRQKFRNVERDPRVTVMIWDKEDPYRFVEVRGEVVEKVTGPEARKHIDELSQKYRGRPYQQSRIRSERVVLRIAPLRQIIRMPS
jgi:PPOX class probable F420-dependent enzyme